MPHPEAPAGSKEFIRDAESGSRTSRAVGLLLMLLIGFTFSTRSTADEADTSVLVASFHEHKFLSAPVVLREEIGLYYEICNLSDQKSGFHWKVAGFGLGATNELMPSFCATKRKRFIGHFKPFTSDVYFQDGSSGRVETYADCHTRAVVDSCRGGHFLAAAYRYFAELAIFADVPDETNVSMETIAIGYRTFEDHAEITITSSDGFDHIVLALKGSASELEELSELFDGDIIEIQTFAYFKENFNLEDTFLTNDIGRDTPIISISRRDGGGHAARIDLRRISRMTGQMVLLGIMKGGIAIRDTLGESDIYAAN